MDARDKCTGFEELDLWASLRGLDPAFVRATAWAESGLDSINPLNSYCAVSAINKTNSCNFLDINPIWDPYGTCNDLLNEKEFEPDEKPCSLGLMQINPTSHASYPYIYWNDIYTDDPSGDLGIEDYAENLKPEVYGENAKERLVAESCAVGGLFNPYNGNHSACYGTWILKEAWNNAQYLVNSKSEELNAKTSMDHFLYFALLLLWG